MPPNEPGRKALDHIDRVLADRPEKNGHELSAALRCLAGFRDGFVAAHREAPDDRFRKMLASVNAIISSVMAAQFPLGDVQWDELVKARDWLAVAIESGYLADADRA